MASGTEQWPVELNRLVKEGAIFYSLGLQVPPQVRYDWTRLAGTHPSPTFSEGIWYLEPYSDC